MADDKSVGAPSRIPMQYSHFRGNGTFRHRRGIRAGCTETGLEALAGMIRTHHPATELS